MLPQLEHGTREPVRLRRLVLPRLFATLLVAAVGSVLVATVSTPASATEREPCTIENPTACLPPDPPAPDPDPWMDPAPVPPPAPPVPPPAPPDPAPECATVPARFTSDDQLVTRPSGLNALFYSATVDYCYNSRRDIVKVTPIYLRQVQLPDSERQNDLSVGAIGTITITGEDRNLPRITAQDRPIRTAADNTVGEGEVYFGTYTVRFTFQPASGPIQRYSATLTIIIDSIGASEFPPRLDRS